MADLVFSIFIFTLKGQHSGNILLPTKATKKNITEKVHFHVIAGSLFISLDVNLARLDFFSFFVQHGVFLNGRQ